MRTSQNKYEGGRLINGYDYDNQAWVIGGRYVRCGHPERMQCKCYGRLHEGEKTKVSQELHLSQETEEILGADLLERMARV